MQARERQDYTFGRFYLDTRERVLLCDGNAVPITLKAFNILFVLVQSSGHIVEKDELMKQVWPNAFVEEANLTQHIYKLRKILGSKADGRQYIETVPRRGYRFTAATSMPGRDGDRLAMQRRDDNIAGIPTSEATTNPEPTIISLAIVPFTFASVDSDAEYLSDCVTESLTSILSGLPQLRIMSRNIVFAVQEQNAPDANHVKPDS
jgi:DNA-binding winged helix-turn-helix (wHTH) protein